MISAWNPSSFTKTTVDHTTCVPARFWFGRNFSMVLLRPENERICPLTKGQAENEDNTSEPTIDFQGTFVSFRGGIYFYLGENSWHTFEYFHITTIFSNCRVQSLAQRRAIVAPCGATIGFALAEFLSEWSRWHGLLNTIDRWVTGHTIAWKWGFPTCISFFRTSCSYIFMLLVKLGRKMVKVFFVPHLMCQNVKYWRS